MRKYQIFFFVMCMNGAVVMSAAAATNDTVEVIDVVVEDEQERAAPVGTQRVGQPHGVWTADPFNAMRQMQSHMQAMNQRMDQMFDDPFFSQPSPVGIGSVTTTYDLGGQRYEEAGEQLILHIPLSGIVPDSCEITVSGRMITISGEQEETTDEQFVAGGMPSGMYSTMRSSFYKSFALDERADPEQYTVEHDEHEVRIVFEKKK